MQHNTSLECIDGKYVVQCSAYDLNEKHDSRNAAFLACHLHIVTVGQLELAVAGTEDHD